MATTTLISWTNLTGSIFEQRFGVDSDGGLNPSDNPRGAMVNAARNRLIESADKFLIPYGAQMLNNGEIVLDRDVNALTWNQSAENKFRKMLAGIDYHDILAPA